MIVRYGTAHNWSTHNRVSDLWHIEGADPYGTSLCGIVLGNIGPRGGLVDREGRTCKRCTTALAKLSKGRKRAS